MQEFISNLATNFYLVKASATAIKLVAGTDEDQVSIGLGGPWRFRTETYTLNISGGAGTKTIWAVAVTANDFEGVGEDPDETDYDFELRATTGAEPGSVFYARKVGTVVWDGAAITSIQQTVNKTTGAMIESGALSGSGDLEWTQEASGAWVPSIKNDSVTDAKLASPNNATWKRIFSVTQPFGAGAAKGGYLLGMNPDASPPLLSKNIDVTTTVGNPLFYLDHTDHAVDGLTTKFRLRVGAFTNGTKPTLKFTFWLIRIYGSQGNPGEIGVGSSGVVLGSDVRIEEPGINQVTKKVSGWFTHQEFEEPGTDLTPSHYGIYVETDDVMDTGAFVLLTGQLEVQNS